MRQALAFTIGGASLRVEALPLVLDALLARYGAFATEDACDITLRIEAADHFAPELERDSAARVLPDGEHAITLHGAARGHFDLRTRSGQIFQAGGLGPVDSLIRAALSLVLPEQGALLIHGALVPGVVFAGASGSGKSTVANALGALCDELVVLRPAGTGLSACSTPYWQGRPWQGACHSIVCLRRAGDQAPRGLPLEGAAAVRALLPNVVRYASLPRTERAIFALAATVCARATVIDALCPSGGAYLPFIHTLMQEAA